MNTRAQVPSQRSTRAGPCSRQPTICINEHVDWWGPYLRRLLELGNDVLIVSKPEFKSIGWICNNLSAYKDQIEFRFTIGTNDATVAKYWEPGAPVPSERMISLAFAFQCKFRTSVSMEPLLTEFPELIIPGLCSVTTGEIWIGRMNHYALNPEIPEEAYQIKVQSKENMQRIYDVLKDNPQIRWKDSVRDLPPVREIRGGAGRPRYLWRG